MRAIYEKNKQAIHDIAILLVSILVCFLFLIKNVLNKLLKLGLG